MSSRSFRRRNARRRHNRQAGAGDPQSPAQRDQGGSPEQDRGEAGRRGQGPNGSGRGPQSDRPQGGRRPQGDRGQDGSRQGNSTDSAPQRSQQPFLYPECPICQQPVRDLASALTHRETGQPAHFDCVMCEIRDANELSPQEKICYLGAGSFGILDFPPSGGPARFVIRKRIQYEEKEAAVAEWKKPLLIAL